MDDKKCYDSPDFEVIMLEDGDISVEVRRAGGSLAMNVDVCYHCGFEDFQN